MQTALKKASNWKSPGPDAVPNFFLKQLTTLHLHLLNTYNQATEHPENLPDWFTTAETYLLPKNKDTENPKNYRPIACLSTSYKVLTLEHPPVSVNRRTPRNKKKNSNEADSLFRLNFNVHIDSDNRERAKARDKHIFRWKKNMNIL